MNFSETFATHAAAWTPPAPAPAEEASFSPLEWNVIALAKHDSPRSLDEPSRLSRAMGSLFGMGVGSKLADPRLEALRRVAVLAWRRGFALPLREIERFLASGFVEAQLETLVTSVTGLKIAATRRGRFA